MFNPLNGEESVWSAANCRNWPIETSMPPQKFHNGGQQPILLVGSSHDFVTPLSWAADMAKQIKHSSLLRTDNYSRHMRLGRPAS